MSSDPSGEIYVVVKDETANGSHPEGGGGEVNGGKVSEGTRVDGVKRVGLTMLGVLVGLLAI